jgi:cytochrome c biogenesis protein CcdA
MSPSPIEIVISVAWLMAVLFALFSVLMMALGKWSIVNGVLLLVATFVIPFGGPIILIGLAIRNRMRSSRIAPA